MNSILFVFSWRQLLFEDFFKVYDSIHRRKMEQKILAYDLPKESVTTIMMLYKNAKAPYSDTDFFDIESTGWNYKIVAIEKTIWFHFRRMKTGFLFLLQTIYQLASCVQISRAIRAFYHVWKWHNDQRVRSEMRRSTTHALYRSKLWQQDHCQHPQNTNPDGSTCYGYGLWCGFKWGPHNATSYLRSRLESQHQSVPGCAEECGDLLVQSGGRWQILRMAAGLGASPQVQRDPGLASDGMLRLCTGLSLAPSSPDLNLLDYFVWSTVENITNMTSHNTKASLIAAIRRGFAELPPALVEKACSQFRIRIEAVIETEGGYIE